MKYSADGCAAIRRHIRVLVVEAQLNVCVAFVMSGEIREGKGEPGPAWDDVLGRLLTGTLWSLAVSNALGASG